MHAYCYEADETPTTITFTFSTASQARLDRTCPDPHDRRAPYSCACPFVCDALLFQCARARDCRARCWPMHLHAPWLLPWQIGAYDLWTGNSNHCGKYEPTGWRLSCTVEGTGEVLVVDEQSDVTPPPYLNGNSNSGSESSYGLASFRRALRDMHHAAAGRGRPRPPSRCPPLPQRSMRARPRSLLALAAGADACCSLRGSPPRLFGGFPLLPSGSYPTLGPGNLDSAAAPSHSCKFVFHAGASSFTQRRPATASRPPTTRCAPRSCDAMCARPVAGARDFADAS